MIDDPDSEAFRGQPEPWWHKYVSLFFAIAIFAVLWLASGGCVHQRGSIHSGDAYVVAPKDAGKPATIDSGVRSEGIPLPAGSSVVMTKFAPLAAIPAIGSNSAVDAQPAREVTEIKLSAPTEWRKTETTISANTGTTDTSIASHRIDVAESRPLLYAALGAALGAGVFLYLKYPTPAYICGGAAAVFFIAWKVSGVPAWLWAVGAIALAAAAFLYLGHERGEKHAAEAK